MVAWIAVSVYDPATASGSPIARRRSGRGRTGAPYAVSGGGIGIPYGQSCPPRSGHAPVCWARGGRTTARAGAGREPAVAREDHGIA